MRQRSETVRKSPSVAAHEDSPGDTVFIARQPVFNRRLTVCGYELLFRSRPSAEANVSDDLAATAHVLRTTFLELGLSELTGGLPALVNFAAPHLIEQLPLLFPPQWLVVEVLESVVPEAPLYEALLLLRGHGYRIALDDVTTVDLPDPFLRLADIVKVDFLALTSEQRVRTTHSLRNRCSRGIRFLAEKVESRTDMQEAHAMGYHYFQGFFFARPELRSGKTIPSHKLTLLQLLREISNPEFEYSRLDRIIKADVGLTTKLLTYINAAAFPWSRRIESVKQALVLLGESQIRKWISLVTLGEMASDKPLELVRLACFRGRWLELLHSRLREYTELECFLVGALANLDAILDVSLEEALERVSPPEAVVTALQGGDSRLGNALRSALAYERGDWDQVVLWATRAGLQVEELSRTYRESLAWTEKLFSAGT